MHIDQLLELGIIHAPESYPTAINRYISIHVHAHRVYGNRVASQVEQDVDYAGVDSDDEQDDIQDKIWISLTKDPIAMSLPSFKGISPYVCHGSCFYRDVRDG